MTVLAEVLPDIRQWSPQAREQAAWEFRSLYDVEPWPALSWFNSAPCSRHAELTPGCMNCGLRLRRHQRTGAAWLYVAGRGLLCDTVGSGKTAIIAAVLAMCKEHGELSLDNRAVIVCQAAAVYDPWTEQLRRLLPGIPLLTATGDRDERVSGYLGNWEVAIVSDRTFAPARGRKVQRDGDLEYLTQFGVGICVYDDIDAMRNHSTQAAYAVKRLAAGCTRVIGAHATPLQKRLVELHSFLEPVGGREILGPVSRVRTRYVTQKKVYIWGRDRSDPTGQKRTRRTIWTDSGVKEDRMPEFKAKIAPLVLRRRAADMDDVDIPGVQPHPVTIELSAAQRERYDELRQGVLRRLRDTGEEITQAEAQVAFTRGAQICSGLASLDDGRDDSAKLDWLMDMVTGDLGEEKVVAYIHFRPNVQAMSERLAAAGVGHVLMWSEETDPQVRYERLTRFRTDPACRVLLGTTTMERSLNLQVARHFVAVDTIMNPARMTQMVGRVQRQGSAYPMIFFHHLLAGGTQEDGYLAVLRAEQAVADSVWDERSEVFPGMSPRQLLQLVATGRAV